MLLGTVRSTGSIRSFGALLVLGFLLMAAAAHAETIELKDGTKVSGSVVEENDDTVTLKVKYGTIKYPKKEIKSRDADDIPEPVKKPKSDVAATAKPAQPEKAAPPEPPAAKTPPAPAPAAVAEQPSPGSTPAKTLPWTDAPASALAAAGINSPRQVLDSARSLIQQIVASNVELDKQWRAAQTAMSSYLGVDPTDPVKLATLGLDASQPLHLSVLEFDAGGQPSGLVVSFGVSSEAQLLTFVKTIAGKEQATLTEDTAAQPKVLVIAGAGALAVADGRGYFLDGPKEDKLPAALRQFIADKDRSPILQAPGVVAALEAIGGPGETTVYVDLKPLIQYGGTLPPILTDFRSVSFKANSTLSVASLNFNPGSRLVKALKPGASPKDFIAKADKPLLALSISLADPAELVRYIAQNVPDGDAFIAKLSKGMLQNSGLEFNDWGALLKDGNLGVLLYKADPPANFGALVYLKLKQDAPDRVAKAQAGADTLMALLPRMVPMLAQSSFEKAQVGDYLVFGNAVQQLQKIKANGTAQWQPENTDGDILAINYAMGEVAQHLQKVAPNFNTAQNALLVNAARVTLSLQQKGDSVQYSNTRIESNAATMGLIAAIFFPTLARTREAARRAASAANLSQIGKAMILYAGVPGNTAYPKDPLALFPDFVSNPRYFRNPRFADQDVGYIYLPGSTPKDAENIVIFENILTPNPPGRNAVLGDGSVVWFDESEFQQDLQKTTAALKAAGIEAKQVPISFKAVLDKKKK